MRAYLLIFIGTIFIIAGCSNWTDENIRASREIGNSIVEAIEKYKTDNRVYPSELSELVPDYLDEIPPPLAGSKRWKYKLFDHDARFELAFEGPSDSDPTSWIGSGDNGHWSMDTK